MLHASEYFDAAANGTMAKLGVEVTPKLNLDRHARAARDAVKELTKRHRVPVQEEQGRPG
jgi:dihydrolipoamide dehydrogenase